MTASSWSAPVMGGRRMRARFEEGGGRFLQSRVNTCSRASSWSWSELVGITIRGPHSRPSGCSASPPFDGSINDTDAHPCARSQDELRTLTRFPCIMVDELGSISFDPKREAVLPACQLTRRPSVADRHQQHSMWPVGRRSDGDSVGDQLTGGSSRPTPPAPQMTTPTDDTDHSR